MTIKQLSFRTFCLCAAAILLISLAFGVYWGMQKQALFIDETFSYMLSNSQTDYGLHANITPDTWTDASAFSTALCVTPGEEFDYHRVYLNQEHDVHPPLYYDVLHTVSSFFPGQFSIWFGIGINMFFYAAGFVVLAAILLLITQNNRALALAILLIYATNCSTMSLLLFIRMYMMFTFFTLLVTWLHLLVLRGKLRFPIFLMLTAISCFLGFLTQYFFLIYMAFLCLLYSIHLLVRKPYGAKSIRYFVMYAASLLIALGATYVAFPPWVDHLFSGQRGIGSFSAFSGEAIFSFVNEKAYYGILNDTLFAGTLTYLLLAIVLLVIVTFFVHRKQCPGNAKSQAASPVSSFGLWLTTGTVVLFLWIAARAGLPGVGASHVIFRFIVPGYALLLSLVMLAMYKLSAGLLKRSAWALVCTLVLFGFINVLGYRQSYRIDSRIAQGEPLFAYSFEQEHLDFAQAHKDTPVVVLFRNRIGYHRIITEMMQYRQLYFTHVDYYNIDDASVAAAEDCEELIVYIPYGDEDEGSYLGFILETFPWLYGEEWQYDTLNNDYSVYLFSI